MADVSKKINPVFEVLDVNLGIAIRIAIDDAACVQCGYCAALCPVDGIRVNPVRST